MRMLVGTIALLLAITSFSLFMYHQTATISNELTTSLMRLKNNIKQEEWAEAHSELKSLHASWEKADSWWTPFMDHREINDLAQAIARLSTLVEIGQKNEALVEVDAAVAIVQRIMEREGPSIKNIF